MIKTANFAALFTRNLIMLAWSVPAILTAVRVENLDFRLLLAWNVIFDGCVRLALKTQFQSLVSLAIIFKITKQDLEQRCCTLSKEDS